MLLKLSKDKNSIENVDRSLLLRVVNGMMVHLTEKQRIHFNAVTAIDLEVLVTE